MKKWKNFKRNKSFLVLMLGLIFVFCLGIYYYIKLKDSLIVEQIDLSNIIRNNSLIHIILVLIIFFASFFMIGCVIGILALFYEVVCLIILGIFFICNMNIVGIFMFLFLCLFKGLYVILLFYLISRSLIISKNILLKRGNFSESSRYIKQSLITSSLIIIIELFNFFVGYKIMGIFAF